MLTPSRPERYATGAVVDLSAEEQPPSDLVVDILRQRKNLERGQL